MANPILPSQLTLQRMSEAEAIGGCLSGHPEAFELLYHLHKRRIYTLCLRMVRNAADAEDLTQEAFIQIFRKIATFRRESAFSTWVYRLSVNVVLSHLRKKGPDEVSLDQRPDEDAQPHSRKEFSCEDLSLLGAVDRVTLEKAIAELPKGIGPSLFCMISRVFNITKSPK